jgi:aryl-alcohol dehydrogenase-like predicted oxidoreductase
MNILEYFCACVVVRSFSKEKRRTMMTIPVEQFGRTGHMSTRTIFGAAALGSASQEEADRVLELLLRYGVNHIDTASSYGDAELRIAPWMQRYRSQFFLATKADQRTSKEAKEEVHRSLERMQVDYVDLWQLHSLADPIEWDTALSPGGVLEAAIEAKNQGLIRAIGITGHGLQIAATIRRSLGRFDFDTVLLPYNYLTIQKPYYAENFDAVLALCQQRGTAVQTIKSIAYKPWLGRQHTHTTWYEPLEDQQDIDMAVHWALKRPGIFLNTVGDMQLLPKVLDAASRFQGTGPTDEEMQAMVARLGMQPLFV